MDRKMVNFIKEQYPPGTRVRLNAMDDPYHPILPGTEGEVDFVDDKGQIFMKWDNGRTLPLAPGEDSFTVLPPTLTTLKLYMPLNLRRTGVTLVDGCLGDDGLLIDSRFLAHGKYLFQKNIDLPKAQ